MRQAVGLAPRGSPLVEVLSLQSSTGLGGADGLWLAKFGARDIHLSSISYSVVQGCVESRSGVPM